MENRPKLKCYDVDVIIAGAGISGISAAVELSRNQINNFMVLEGDRVIGGRIKEMKLGNMNVEIGANWIHGTANNPLYEMAKKYKIKGAVDDDESIICKDENGNDRTKDFVAIRRKLQTIIDKPNFRDAHKSLREALIMNGWFNKTILENMAEIALFDFMVAVSPNIISALLEKPSVIDSLHDKQFFITEKSGFKKLIQGMVDEFLINSTHKIKLNHLIKKIHWNENGVRVLTDNGQVFTAKAIILTFSIGVLQKSPNLFEPKLPAWKLNSLHKLKMATYTKIFVKFPRRFWDNKQFIFYASKTRGYYPVWQSLDANERFDNVTNTLLVTVTENESERIESLTKEDVMEEIMNILRTLYGDNIPYPTDIVIPKWNKNALFYGSYSYLPKNVVHEDFVALRASVGPMHFAGEALHEVYQGYLHGAYFEGINKANDVIQMLMGYRDISQTILDYDYHDTCLRDACNCC
eukprot:gene16722-18416_t